MSLSVDTRIPRRHGSSERAVPWREGRPTTFSLQVLLIGGDSVSGAYGENPRRPTTFSLQVLYM